MCKNNACLRFCQVRHFAKSFNWEENKKINTEFDSLNLSQKGLVDLHALPVYSEGLRFSIEN